MLASRWFRDATAVALYRAFDGEVATDTIEAAARDAGKRVLHARVAQKNAPLIFVAATAWTTSTRGLPVPVGPPVELNPSDLLIVPGVAFDDAGYRLGFGGGFYDRTLAAVTAVPVGLAYDAQRIDTLPRAPWDQPVDGLVTESGIIEFDHEETQV